MNFYNFTTNSEGKPSICWMMYGGPKRVLVNTTTNQMCEVINWEEDDTAIRSQSCENKEDELKRIGELWNKDTCSQNPIPTRTRIQDREINGLHRIYCYPYNITIEKSTHSCPDYVFELEGRNTYRIANLEHYGSYVEKTVMKTTDLHLNKEIMATLKADEYKIKPIDLSKLDKAYDNYFVKLRQIPKNTTLVNSDLTTLFPILAGPLTFLNKITDQFWNYFETAGIVLGVLAGGMLLIMLAPAIQLILFALGILRVITRLWLNSLRGITDKMRWARPYRSKNYWEEQQKLI